MFELTEVVNLQLVRRLSVVGAILAGASIVALLVWGSALWYINPPGMLSLSSGQVVVALTVIVVFGLGMMWFSRVRTS